jgi:hypothetical protein
VVASLDAEPGEETVRRTIDATADEALPPAALAAGAGTVTIDRDPVPTDGVAALLRHR